MITFSLNEPAAAFIYESISGFRARPLRRRERCDLPRTRTGLREVNT
jgi:hypothetical protein